MYGMINQAFKEMIIENIGEDYWVKICQNLSIPKDDFFLSKKYEDELTLDLVLCLCKIQKRDTRSVLEDFGRFWIQFAFRSEYRDLLVPFSRSPTLLINSLNGLHQRLEFFFQDLEAPSFQVINELDSELIVSYFSQKDLPLKYFVKGLFYGIYNHFNQSCQIQFIETVGAAKATFRISHREAQ